MKVLLENLLRHEDGRTVTKADIEAMAAWLDNKGKAGKEIGFRPARVLMQDFTGVPAVVDLAAMRDGMTALGGDPTEDQSAGARRSRHRPLGDRRRVRHAEGASADNVELEYERNGERYNFLKWGQGAFENFRVVPPGTGICHQVNLEYPGADGVDAARCADGTTVAYPDTLVGTDSHTTMVNGLAVLGWGVGGIEAEAAMLGQPQSMLIPEVIGFKLTGKLKEGVTATDLVLTVTQMLRKKGVVDKFVEFYGPGLDTMTLADRATIANMAPEYGATCGFFPVDDETLNYLTMSGREPHRIALVEAYAKAQGLFRDAGSRRPGVHRHARARPRRRRALAGRPEAARGPHRADRHQERLRNGARRRIQEAGRARQARRRRGPRLRPRPRRRRHRRHHELHQHVQPERADRAPACSRATPSRRASRRKPWVKTSLAPGSQVVAAYLEKAGLQAYLDQLGFNLVGFGCTTCIGNSGPLRAGDLEGHQRQRHRRRRRAFGQPQLRRPRQPRRAGELPRLAAARRRLRAGRLGAEGSDHGAARHGQRRQAGLPQGHLADLAGNPEVHRREHHARAVQSNATPTCSRATRTGSAIDDRRRPDLRLGRQLDLRAEPALLRGHRPRRRSRITDIVGARILGLFGDKITTDHISPAGSIKAASPGRQVSARARRGGRRLQPVRHAARQPRSDDARHVRQHPHQEPHGEGRGRQRQGRRLHDPLSVRRADADLRRRHALRGGGRAARRLRRHRVRQRLVARLGGQGHQPARRPAVIAQSFERIHRSNLVGMGIVPFVFEEGTTWQSLGLKGDETVTHPRASPTIKPRQMMTAEITARRRHAMRRCPILCRIDTLDEIEYFKNGGILHYVLRNLAAAEA